MTEDSKSASPRSTANRPAGAPRKTGARKVAKPAVALDPVDMTPEDLVAGPGALPDAPMAMPEQVIESHRSLFSRLSGWFRSGPNTPAAPTAGGGV